MSGAKLARLQWDVRRALKLGDRKKLNTLLREARKSGFFEGYDMAYRNFRNPPSKRHLNEAHKLHLKQDFLRARMKQTAFEVKSLTLVRA